MINDIKDKWETLTPKHKQLTFIGGIAAVVVIAIFAGSSEKTVRKAPVEKNKIELIEQNTGSMDMEQLVGQNQLLSTKVLSMQDKIATMDENFKSVKRSLSLNSELAETPQILYDLRRKIDLLQKEQERLLDMGVSTRDKNPNSDTDFIDDIINEPAMSSPRAKEDTPSEGDVFGDSSVVTTTKPDTTDIIPDNPLAYVNAAYANASVHKTDENQYVTSSENFGQPNKPKTGGSIEVFQTQKTKNDNKPAEKEVEWKGAVLPAGTLIPGIVISGVDAPTGKAAEKGAVVSTIRITGPAILPNGERVDLTGCFVVNDVRGDLATQRANFRPQTLTCSLADIGIVDTMIQGYVSGKDGTLGFRGKVVNKQGSALLYAGTAGLIGGFGNAFSGGGGNGRTTITTGGQFDLPSTEDAMTAGVGEGISAASDTLSEYYKEQLDLLYPIIEIKPMIFGSIHLIKTVQLKLFKAN